MDYFIASQSYLDLFIRLIMIAFSTLSIIFAIIFLLVWRDSQKHVKRKILPFKFSILCVSFVLIYAILYLSYAYNFASPIPNHQYGALEEKIKPYANLPKVKAILNEANDQGYVTKTQKITLEHIVDTIE